MPAIVIRNIPEEVHTILKARARAAGRSVESLAREALAKIAQTEPRSGGIDFEALRRAREALGVMEDGPAWTDDLDDPALSRRVLGLDE